MSAFDYIGDVFALEITFEDGRPFIDAIYSNYMAAYEDGERWLATVRSMGLDENFVKYRIITYALRG